MTYEEKQGWIGYDAAAEWCARRGLKGKIGDPLPNLLPGKTVDFINADPEAFEKRVCQCAYEIAMEGHPNVDTFWWPAEKVCKVCGCKELFEPHK